jgi:ABC-2 type transport system permease protein
MNTTRRWFSATWALFKAQFKTTFRNRQGLFWTLFFPVLLMVVFSFLGNSGASKLPIAVSGPDPAASQVVSAFSHGPIFTVHRESLADARAAVKSGTLDAVLVVPAGQSPTAPLHLTMMYNNANLLTSQQVVAAVNAYLAQINLRAAHARPVLSVSVKPLAGSRQTTYIDFLLPGIMAMMVMSTGLFSIGVGLTRWKELGILRRFTATPLKPVQFMGAAILNSAVVSLVTIGIVVAMARFVLHASFAFPFLPIFATMVVGIAAFLAIGFVIAGVSKSQEATMPIVNLVQFPMLFLSGIFFPVSNLPNFLARIVSFFPLTYLVTAVRAFMQGQASAFTPALYGDLLGLGAWLVAMALLAARTWRWE